MPELMRFGVSVERELLEAFDALCEKRGFANRSDAFRQLIRRELAEETLQAKPNTRVAGVLALVYNHHASDLSHTLNEIQHESADAVSATLHIHLDAHTCLEVMTLRGQKTEVETLAEKLRSARGVEQGKIFLYPLD